jgi:hypothetical protein
LTIQTPQTNPTKIYIVHRELAWRLNGAGDRQRKQSEEANEWIEQSKVATALPAVKQMMLHRKSQFLEKIIKGNTRGTEMKICVKYVTNCFRLTNGPRYFLHLCST